MAKEKTAVTKSDDKKKEDNVSTAIHKKVMLKALKDSLGVVTEACEACGLSKQTHYRWIREDAEYAALVSELKETRLDFLETEAHKRVKAGSDTMIIFLLKTQAKGRGYVERSEHIVETTESLANRIDYQQAENLLGKAGIEVTPKNDDLAADE